MVENNQVLSDSKQYIVVKIDNEQYGIDIGYVDNIVRMQRITRVPMAQPYFKGVINLRGDVIPVMSMRLKFELETDEISNKTRIIIIKTDQQALVGILVDEVKEVVTLEDSEIEKVMHDKNKEDQSVYLTGIGKHAGELISLLNIVTVIEDD